MCAASGEGKALFATATYPSSNSPARLTTTELKPRRIFRTGKNSSFTADEIVSKPLCQTFIPDHWSINASHPGAQVYYDSVVAKWADEGM